MAKFYKQNKKRIDPRYFMDEKIEEAVIEPGLTKGGQWPGIDPHDRARKLAHDAMIQQQSGEIPPWQPTAGDKEGDGFTDAKLSEADYDVLKWILKDLRIGVGRGNMASRFVSVMAKLGVALDGEERSAQLDSEVPDVDADDMEDSLSKFQDDADRQAWKNKQRGPRST